LLIFIELTLEAEEIEKSNVLVFRPTSAAAGDDIANLTQLIEVSLKAFL
jgi:hypothetical protein